MLKTIKFATALVKAVSWVCVAKVGCLCDAETRKAWKGGERFDRVDDAIKQLDLAWVALVGK